MEHRGGQNHDDGASWWLRRARDRVGAGTGSAGAAARQRPFAAEIKRLLHSRLDAVQDEQAQRARGRDEEVAAAPVQRCR
jgi:hypothetical protein